MMLPAENDKEMEGLMVSTDLYAKLNQIEPLFPQAPGSELSDLAGEVIQKSAALGASVHPKTSQAVFDLVRAMNSYYSNLIEGHNILPSDIEKALRKDYSSDPAKRALQIESTAHIEVQKLIEKRLAENIAINICQKDFICWIHEEFYKRLPDEFRKVKSKDGTFKLVKPGCFRQDEVEVGAHLAPSYKSLDGFLGKFSAVYGNEGLSKIDQVIAIAASHHRLAWIHPFLDGNGRVVRLFSHAFLIKAKIDGHGMWTVSRGLARKKENYIAALAAADSHRQGDLDGRGNLSNAGLVIFCKYFLSTALDQIDFMSDLLNFDGLQKRINSYVEKQVSLGELQPESRYLLQEVYLKGEVPRGEAARITGRPQRSAHEIFKQLMRKGLLVSDTERGPLRLAFPAKAVGYYFPRLYPEGVEVEMEES